MAGMASLRAAVIGLGGMGRRQIEAVRQAGLPVVAVCDVAEAAFPAAVALCGGAPRSYTRWQDLVERERGQAEILLIATNGPSHHAIALAAASAGYPYILCEKPMATSGRAAREMAQACAAAGARLAVNLARRFYDRSIRLKQLIAGGAIGELQHINVSVGAGGLGCIGTHYFDLVAWLADTRPVWVSGEVDRNPAPNVRGAQFFDPGGCGMAGYANGMTACYQLSGEAAITPYMQIVGTDGVVNLDNWTPPQGGKVEVFARPAAQRGALKTRFVLPERVPFEAGAAMDVVRATRACLDDLVGAHRENTVAGGIDAVDTVIGFHLSSRRGGARVALPLVGDDLDFDVPIT
ncbi:MAG: Inositol 2-dehydrogenase/D-chiro-inositol 3-dehydrogenase [Bacteroidia bacterium]|mgnify:CR=1 FL=1|nr:Inositol 2-dehydrogenase/D-chiro-inositol 3-dehydrogenase [Bacteroidia bacterium]